MNKHVAIVRRTQSLNIIFYWNSEPTITNKHSEFGTCNNNVNNGKLTIKTTGWINYDSHTVAKNIFPPQKFQHDFFPALSTRK